MTVHFGSSPTTVSWIEPIGVASVAASQSSGSFVVVGYTNVVYTATDPSGNFESCSFSVTVTGTIYQGMDGTRPSFLIWPSNIDMTVPFGSSPTTVSWIEPIGVASVRPHKALDLSLSWDTLTWCTPPQTQAATSKAALSLSPSQTTQPQSPPTALRPRLSPGPKPIFTDSSGVVTSNFNSGSSFPTVTYTETDFLSNVG
ncbi:hyalin-like isoform X5 [Strongylocentrotus purpuratus]|uniref:HYR domain-containing protein n=1 Tax=Strongylocentrotus purpuratus TaxID=7668 RepID=A0A7M7PNC6_STRPU|nr:hyalin-like isoform X5 [Strongylocentrotus purpuratus]XP_030853247.1 hyalin-like isoform X5 [Strongylocentrotus purpuratus]XP_030853248.1 hyalin-like isoform X5 [Strongylocentrotus purpuratus]